MDELHQENLPPEEESKKPGSARFAIPFFAVLAVLTVIAFILPLRPTKSYGEKRNLAEFPDFSLSALASGAYFDDIGTWFADTFPGREGWLKLAASVDSLHGFSDITIYGDLPQSSDEIPTANTQPTKASAVETTQAATEPEPVETEAPTLPEPPPQTTPPTTPVEEWGGIDAGEDAEIIFGNVLQIGDSAFNYFSFSQYWSDYYVSLINDLADAVADKGVTVVSALIPTSVGIMIEPEYMEKIGCADQGQAIDYMLSGMNDNIVKVDMYQTLVDHNSEYIYFRTDHHWTALGAYYGYTDLCQALGYQPASLDSFALWDQGEFEGSLYWSCNQSSRLRLDYVYAYNPPGDIEVMITGDNGYAFPWTVLTDMSGSDKSSKYMTFLAGDHSMTEITNNDLPDAPSCVVVKDSFGNAIAPFLTQNYHKVYVMDFRSYFTMDLRQFVEVYDVDQILFLHTLAMTQTDGPSSLFYNLCS